MKLMFICGSLEPGRDGVGDYVRRLSGALVRMGHSVSAMSWHDPYVTDSRKEVQASEGVDLSVLRVSSSLKSADRDAAAQKFVSWIDPDLISLQFVPYAFHKKGLPFLLRRSLAPLIKGRYFHVLFHELWLDTPANLKQKITAIIQRKLILKLIRTLSPQLVNVTIAFNQERFARFRIEVEILGLFGNIYPAATSTKEFSVEEPNRPLSLIYFGEVPKGTFKTIFLSEFASFCKKYAQNVKLLLACGNSAAKDKFYGQLQQVLSGCEYELLDCGFLSILALSELMQDCQAGISKSKPHLLAKSGAAMAMLEHGLPIWMPRWDGADVVSVNFRKQLVFTDLEAALSAPKLQYQSLLPEVANNFIHQLNVFREEKIK